MIPYQEASDEIQRQSEVPLNIAKKTVQTGIGLGTAALGGGAILGRIVPFLSKYIPPALAIKGLNKIDPRFGKFIDTALKNGKPFDEIKDFISEKIQSGQQQEQPKQEKAQDKRNIVRQYSDELDQFIQNEVDKGRHVLEAGNMAQLQEKYKKIIKKIEDDTKTKFSSILNSTYGASMKRPSNKEEAVQAYNAHKKKGQGLVDQLQDQFQQNYPQQQQPQQQQPGQGQQALMAILQKINQTRGGNG